MKPSFRSLARTEKHWCKLFPRRKMQDGYITIPGSSNPDHIAEIFIVFDFELSEQEMEEIRSIDTQNLNESW